MDPTTDRLTEIRERAEKALRTPDLEWARDLVYGLANDVLALHSELQALLAKCPEGFSSKYVLGVEHHHRTALAVVSWCQRDPRTRVHVLGCRVAGRSGNRHRGQ